METIKKFKDFIKEELSPEVLDSASGKAIIRGQHARADKFSRASNKLKSEARQKVHDDCKKEINEIIGGELFGSKEVFYTSLVRKGKNGASINNIQISIKNPDIKAKGQKISNMTLNTKTWFTENNEPIPGNKFKCMLDIRDDKNNEVQSEGQIKNAIITRKQALGFHKLSNWITGETKPFNVDDFTIAGVHANVN